MKRTFLALALLLAVSAGAAAQDRVGYANLELVIAKMPESQDLGRQLEAYQGELAQALDTKQKYAQQKFAEWQDAKAAGVVSEAKLAEEKAELERLDREIRQTAVESDKKMMQKRDELMGPVIEKLQDVIRQVAEAEGYTHVLNVMDGTGTSILLWGVEERDLTERILAKMGVSLETGGE